MMLYEIIESSTAELEKEHTYPTPTSKYDSYAEALNVLSTYEEQLHNTGHLTTSIVNGSFMWWPALVQAAPTTTPRDGVLVSIEPVE